MGLGFRIGLISAYFAKKRDFAFSFTEFIRSMVRPSVWTMSKRYIDSISQDGDFLVLSLVTGRVLYWPSSLPRYDLSRVIVENCEENDWHYYEIPETAVRHGEIVLDCGAAEGIFSAKVANRAGRVVAFEPSPLFVRALRLTFNGTPNVTVVPMALSNKEGDIVVAEDGLSTRISSEVGKARVPATTVDSWASQFGLRVDYIKADLEGHELNMLRGAANTIHKFRPKLAITVYHPGNSWVEILEYCRSLVPEYQYRLKGFSCLDGVTPKPVMIHLWVSEGSDLSKK